MAENERPDAQHPWQGPAPVLPQQAQPPAGPQQGQPPAGPQQGQPPPPLRGQQPPPPPPPPLPRRQPEQQWQPQQQGPHPDQQQWRPSGPPPGQPPPETQPREPQPPIRTPRLVGALAMVVAAVVATAFTVTWILNKAEALSPVDLPSANGTPLEKIDPSVKPTETPPPRGKYVDGYLVAANNDRMLGMPQPTWKESIDSTGLYGGAAMWMTVHENYDGAKDWGNVVAFGGLGKGIPYSPTPAGLKLASRHVASRMVANLYPGENVVPIKGSVKHRPITVGGHRAHELVARIPIKKPKLKETNSVIAVVVIDRGDGTAVVSVADVAGTTTGWFLYWRNQVQKIQINR